MRFLRRAAGVYLLNRLLRGSRRPSRSAWYGGYRLPYARRGRSSGFGMRGPFPTYSRRTRGGSRVTVTGCCLPLPLVLRVGAAVSLARAMHSR